MNLLFIYLTLTGSTYHTKHNNHQTVSYDMQHTNTIRINIYISVHSTAPKYHLHDENVSEDFPNAKQTMVELITPMVSLPEIVSAFASMAEERTERGTAMEYHSQSINTRSLLVP